MRARRRLGVRLVLGLLLGGCGVNTAPRLDAIEKHVAAVGDELTIPLRASDADGDPLRFEFACGELPDLATRNPRPSIETDGSGLALFHFIPQASDARSAPYHFDFIASDGKAEGRRSAEITVRTQGGSGAPVFVRPIGSGTTLKVDDTPCLSLDLEVLDTDSISVVLGQEAPIIPGATLEQTGSFTGTWRWCPTPEQVQAQDRYYVSFSADDGANPKVLKLPGYLVVLIGSGSGVGCPGSAPVILHTPMSAQNTVQDLKVSLVASDDKGLKGTPLLYWSLKDPGTPPVLSGMSPVATTRTSGDAFDGTYEGVIPNPIASAATGTQRTLYYVLGARDNDDPTGNCNHTTYAPMSDHLQFVVTSTGGAGLASCQACTSDNQCGGLADNCITVGGTLRCGVACGPTSSCPAGYLCTANPVTSVDGASAPQCIPLSGTCAATFACVDDTFEQNDSLPGITNSAAQSLTGASYPTLVLCPLANGSGGVDEDWYGIPVTTEGRIEVVMTSSASTDLDLILTTADGSPIDYSLSLSSNERVAACLRPGAGKVYAHVYSSATTPATAAYALQINRTAMVCP